MNDQLYLCTVVSFNKTLISMRDVLRKTKLLITNYKLLTIDILNVITKLNSCSN